MAATALLMVLAGTFAVAAVVPRPAPGVPPPPPPLVAPLPVPAAPGAAGTGAPAAAVVASWRKKTATAAAPRRWDTHLHARPGKGQFRRFFRMKVTAYTPINTRMEGGRYTVTERDGRSAHGIAVDADLIPLGTRLWIPGYGHAVADDIGGRIQGHRVDLRMQNARQMRSWGVRQVRVYVLHDP